MIRLHPSPTRTDTLFPHTKLVRSYSPTNGEAWAGAGAAIRAAAMEAMGSRVRMMRSCVRRRRDASPFHLPCHPLGARALGQDLLIAYSRFEPILFRARRRGAGI